MNQNVQLQDFQWANLPDKTSSLDEVIEEYKTRKAADEKFLPEDLFWGNGQDLDIDLLEKHFPAEVAVYKNYKSKTEEGFEVDYDTGKATKTWKYYAKSHKNYEFYIEKAKYVLKNHYRIHKHFNSHGKPPEEIEQMPNEMFEELMDNYKFTTHALETYLVQAQPIIIAFYSLHHSIRDIAQTFHWNRGTVENELKKVHAILARKLIAKDRWKEFGEQGLKSYKDYMQIQDKINYREDVELLGMLIDIMHNKLLKLQEQEKKAQ